MPCVTLESGCTCHHLPGHPSPPSLLGRLPERPLVVNGCPSLDSQFDLILPLTFHRVWLCTECLCPSKTPVLKPQPQGTVSGGGAPRWDSCSCDGDAREPPSPLPPVRAQKTLPKNQAVALTRPAGVWIWDVQPPDCEEEMPAGYNLPQRPQRKTVRKTLL